MSVISSLLFHTEVLWLRLNLVILDVLSFLFCPFFFFKQKTAYEMRISDWSSDVCSSDLDYFFNYKIHQISYRKKFNKSHIGMHSHTTWYSRSAFRELDRKSVV